MDRWITDSPASERFPFYPSRIVLDPVTAPDLDPDDILVAPTTDPSWASLFLTVDGSTGTVTVIEVPQPATT